MQETRQSVLRGIPWNGIFAVTMLPDVICMYTSACSADERVSQKWSTTILSQIVDASPNFFRAFAGEGGSLLSLLVPEMCFPSTMLYPVLTQDNWISLPSTNRNLWIFFFNYYFIDLMVITCLQS